MYRHRGNSAHMGAKPRRKPAPTPAQSARYIAESIEQRLAHGLGFTLGRYGIMRKPEMIALVIRALEGK